jgi:hypothetical protein
LDRKKLKEGLKCIYNFNAGICVLYRTMNCKPECTYPAVQVERLGKTPTVEILKDRSMAAG